MSNVLQFKKKPSGELNLTRAEGKTWAILDSSMTDVANLAETFGVSQQTVRNVKLLKSKRAEKVAALMQEHGVQPKTWTPAARFTKAQIAEIRTSTETSKKLAHRFECSPSTIRMIKTGKTYV